MFPEGFRIEQMGERRAPDGSPDPLAHLSRPRLGRLGERLRAAQRRRLRPGKLFKQLIRFINYRSLTKTNLNVSF